ncbi:MAG: SLC13 family permease [Candidatus Omnitrophota bacterium]
MVKKQALKFSLLLLIPLCLGFYLNTVGLDAQQSLSVAMLLVSVLGTLFFWEFRLSFVFIGTALLLITKVIDVEHLVWFSSLEIILFLVGMMVMMGLLKEAGFFAWLVTLILRIRNLTAQKFFFAITIISALLACAIDEVTSIVFMVAAILEICDYFEVDPVPYIISSVLATNIGSAGTVLGNPIGILIATKAGLHFEDFLIKAFPIMLLCLFVTILILKTFYRRALKHLDDNIKELGANEFLVRLISIPPDKQLKTCLGIFGASLVLISLHHRLELALDLPINTILLVTPLIFAGIVMVWKRERARHYIETDVEWWTLLFFLLLFAQTGALKYTGASDVLVKKLFAAVNYNTEALVGVILWVSAILSSVLDNVIVVAAFVPILQSVKEMGLAAENLWWALLFGGCLGGNISLVGSTANIVALGILEKERAIKISFWHWLKIGFVVGVITTFICWVCLLYLPLYR